MAGRNRQQVGGMDVLLGLAFVFVLTEYLSGGLRVVMFVFG